MEELLRKAGYSEKAIDYVTHKTNVGRVENPSVSMSFTGHCGDTMEVYLQIENDIIRDSGFEAVGCAGAFSAGSALMEMIRGLNIDQAMEISSKDIVNFLGGVPKHKLDCVDLARMTLFKTIDQYKNNDNDH